MKDRGLKKPILNRVTLNYTQQSTGYNTWLRLMELLMKAAVKSLPILFGGIVFHFISDQSSKES